MAAATSRSVRPFDPSSLVSALSCDIRNAWQKLYKCLCKEICAQTWYQQTAVFFEISIIQRGRWIYNIYLGSFLVFFICMAAEVPQVRHCGIVNIITENFKVGLYWSSRQHKVRIQMSYAWTSFQPYPRYTEYRLEFSLENLILRLTFWGVAASAGSSSVF